MLAMRDRLRRTRPAGLVTAVLLGYAVFVAIVPLHPAMPDVLLDPSWREAMNKAAIGHLVFGRDVVFTYGPYAGVATQMYEPALRVLTLVVSTCYALAAVCAVTLATRRAPAWLRVALAVLLFAGIAHRDVILVLYPLVAVMALESCTREVTDTRRARLMSAARAAALAAPLGLLPLIKISSLPAVGVGGMAMLWILVRRSRWTDALAVVVASLAAGLAAWCAIGQPLLAIVDYVQASLPVITGYSNAMAVQVGSTLTARLGPPAFLITGTVLVALGFLWARTWERRLIAASVLWTLFVVWKAAFVRADMHMAQGAVPLLVAGAIVLPWMPPRPWRRIGLTLSASFVSIAAALVLAASGLEWHDAATQARTSAWGTVTDLVQGRLSEGYLDGAYEHAQASIAALPLPEVRGSVDLYPFELARIFARGERWDPRPVIQSYAAYTRELAMRNARHLASADAPRSVLLQISAIDGRLPSNDDGASWVPLLEHYKVKTYDASSNYLSLRRRPVARRFAIGRPISLAGRFGSPLTLPPTRSGWLASFTVRPTLLGRLRSAAWAPPALLMETTRADGSRVLTRFIPGGAEAPFLLSPMVRDTPDFAALATNPDQSLTIAGVRQIALGVDDGSHQRGAPDMFWQSTYTVRLWPIALSPARG